jgi:hypothetical protein
MHLVHKMYLYYNFHQEAEVYTDVPGVKVTTSGFNSGADSESKSHIHMGPIHNSSGVICF